MAESREFTDSELVRYNVIVRDSCSYLDFLFPRVSLFEVRQNSVQDFFDQGFDANFWNRDDMTEEECEKDFEKFREQVSGWSAYPEYIMTQLLPRHFEEWKEREDKMGSYLHLVVPGIPPYSITCLYAITLDDLPRALALARGEMEIYRHNFKIYNANTPAELRVSDVFNAEYLKLCLLPENIPSLLSDGPKTISYFGPFAVLCCVFRKQRIAEENWSMGLKMRDALYNESRHIAMFKKILGWELISFALMHDMDRGGAVNHDYRESTVRSELAIFSAFLTRTFHCLEELLATLIHCYDFGGARFLIAFHVCLLSRQLDDLPQEAPEAIRPILENATEFFHDLEIQGPGAQGDSEETQEKREKQFTDQASVIERHLTTVHLLSPSGYHVWTFYEKINQRFALRRQQSFTGLLRLDRDIYLKILAEWLGFCETVSSEPEMVLDVETLDSSIHRFSIVNPGFKYMSRVKKYVCDKKLEDDYFMAFFGQVTYTLRFRFALISVLQNLLSLREWNNTEHETEKSYALYFGRMLLQLPSAQQPQFTSDNFQCLADVYKMKSQVFRNLVITSVRDGEEYNRDLKGAMAQLEPYFKDIRNLA